MSRVAGVMAGVLAAGMLATGLAGCAPTRSVQAYCQTFHDEGMKIRAQYPPNQKPGDAVLGLLATPQVLAASFKHLQDVAPDEIEPDVAVLAQAMQRASDDMVDNATSGLKGMLKALMTGITTKPAQDRVDAYTGAHCRPTSAR